VRNKILFLQLLLLTPLLCQSNGAVAQEFSPNPSTVSGSSASAPDAPTTALRDALSAACSQSAFKAPYVSFVTSSTLSSSSLAIGEFSSMPSTLKSAKTEMLEIKV